MKRNDKHIPFLVRNPWVTLESKVEEPGIVVLNVYLE